MGIKASEKRLKLFEYLRITLKIMASYFYKKHIRCQMMNKNGRMILGVLYFFHTEKVIIVVWQSAIVEQLLKW